MCNRGLPGLCGRASLQSSLQFLLAAVSTVVIGFKRRLKNCAAIKGQTVLKTFSLKLIEITPSPKIAAVLLNTCRTPTSGFIISYILKRVNFHLVFRSTGDGRGECGGLLMESLFISSRLF